MALSPSPSRRSPSLRRGLAVMLVAAIGGSVAACASPGASPGTTAGTSPGATAAGGGSTPAIAGTWVSTVTKADLAAGGVSDPNTQNENAGKFTYTFAPDGTWTVIQQSIDGSPINSPVFRGTYTVDGGSMVVTTTFPTEYADAGLHYTWSIDAAGLHLDLLDPPDPVLPVVVESHPWIRGG